MPYKKICIAEIILNCINGHIYKYYICHLAYTELKQYFSTFHLANQSFVSYMVLRKNS
jgi:hypothetical protein